MESQDYQRIAKAMDYIQNHYQNQPDLEDVASFIGLSPAHFQKMFSEWAGVSPKKFLQFTTLQHSKEQLKQHKTLEETAYQVGLSGTSRLHDLFVNIEGMTPATYKLKGKDLEISYGVHPSPFGEVLIATTERGICKISFMESIEIEPVEDTLAELKEEWGNAQITHEPDKTAIIAQQIFESKTINPLKVLLKGTPFQLKVWEALLKIPSGCLVSYSHISQNIEMPTAMRAVGTAIGQNPIAYLIPCHRVIKQSGILGKYRWGDIRKQTMIAWEASQLDRVGER
jgi:AraC family transcriptional regulator, regulatory protein of adaptative response / methylated-DNA-[protein]-cysteine methyltransferase